MLPVCVEKLVQQWQLAVLIGFRTANLHNIFANHCTPTNYEHA